MLAKCFACDRKLGANPYPADTRGDTHSDGRPALVYVGSECFKHIRSAGADGWQPPKGGPRLWVVRQCSCSNVIRHDQDSCGRHA